MCEKGVILQGAERKINGMQRGQGCGEKGALQLKGMLGQPFLEAYLTVSIKIQGIHII